MNWELSNEIDDKRISNLNCGDSFEQIAQNVMSSLNLLCIHKQDCDDNSNFSRIIITIRTTNLLFDLFFNSENGYRASYFKSPYNGLQQNRYFIDQLNEYLVKTKSFCADIENFAMGSLFCDSSKVWLAENGLHLCENCEGEWSSGNANSIDIKNGVWELSTKPNARYGRTAPYCQKLKIFGGFIDDKHNEFVSHKKRRRSHEINECGWS